MKLTPAQKKVIYLLKKGECICLTTAGAYVSEGYTSHKINARVWKRLTIDLGLIRQQFERPFDYILTKDGWNQET